MKEIYHRPSYDKYEYEYNSSTRRWETIKLIVYYPSSDETEAELQRYASKLHTEYVTKYIENLACPTEQKLKLIDAVAEAISERFGS